MLVFSTGKNPVATFLMNFPATPSYQYSEFPRGRIDLVTPGKRVSMNPFGSLVFSLQKLAYWSKTAELSCFGAEK